MPILFQINTIANSGSTGHIAERIAKKVIAEGWICYTAYGRWANPSSTTLFRVGNKVGIYLHGLISRLFDMHGLGSLLATKRLISKIKEIKPDIIHIHNVHGYYLNYILLFDFLSKSNIPVVWTLHDCWAYTGHCVHYTKVNCTKWVDGCYECPNLMDYPTALLWDNSKKNYILKKRAFTSVTNMTIVVVSQWLGNEVKQSFLRRYPIKLICNGIDTSTFYPKSSQIRLKYDMGDKFIILGVATVWNARKGLSDFIKLAKLLSPCDRIILVGLSHKQILTLPSNIIGLGNTENVNELVELYSAADLFVNFSIEETFGLTTAESMACGTPVLVYNSTACSEIVTKNTGFIVEPHDIDGTLNAIRDLKLVGKLQYSENCRSHILKNFREENKYIEYANLYRKLL